MFAKAHTQSILSDDASEPNLLANKDLAEGLQQPITDVIVEEVASNRDSNVHETDMMMMRQ